MWAHDRFGEWVQAGLLTEIEPTEDELNRFQKVAWDAMKVNGKYYGYPVSIEAIAMICNKDIVPEAPKTFEELAALDDKLQKEGKHAIMWDYNNAYCPYPDAGADLILVHHGLYWKGGDPRLTGILGARVRALDGMSLHGS